MNRARTLLAITGALALAAACSGTSIIDPSKPDYASGSHAQGEFQPLRAKWERGDRQTRLDLAPQLRRHMEVYERDPTARTARAMLSLIEVANGNLDEAHSLAAPLIAGDAGPTRDLALVAEGIALRLEGNTELAYEKLEALFGKLLDPFARDLLNEHLSLAAVDLGAANADRYWDAVRFLRGWIAQSGPSERDAVERKIIALLDRIPKDPLVDLVNDVKGTDEIGAPWLLLVGARLASIAIELRDTDLAKFLVREARGLLGERFDEVARIAVKDTGIRLESNTVGLLLSLRSDEHKRRDLEIGKGLARALGIPGSSAQIVSRDDQGREDKIEEALALLNADGAAVIIAGVDQLEADRAKSYGESKGVPVLLLRAPSTPIAANGPVFLLGEDPKAVDEALLGALASRGVSRAAILEGMRGEANVALKIGGLDVVGIHTCGSGSDFVTAQQAKGLVLDAGPTCARESQKALPPLALALGLDVPMDVPGQVRASAGIYPVDLAAVKDAEVLKFTAELGGVAPSWWAGLGHDAGLLAWAAVYNLEPPKAGDEGALAAREALVTKRLGDATGPLWTTAAKGFAGARVMPRALSVIPSP
ncbi:MAG: hypothetical protein U0414_11740 [Polyangiaceae bacterium]